MCQSHKWASTAAKWSFPCQARLIKGEFGQNVQMIYDNEDDNKLATVRR